MKIVILKTDGERDTGIFLGDPNAPEDTWERLECVNKATVEHTPIGSNMTLDVEGKVVVETLTEDRALSEFRLWWGYLATTGDKEKPRAMRKYFQKCALCEYVHGKVGGTTTLDCEKYCPVEWPHGRCVTPNDKEGLYDKWAHASDINERKKYARRIAHLPMKRLRRNGAQSYVWVAFDQVSPYFEGKGTPYRSVDFGVRGPVFKLKNRGVINKLELKKAVNFTRGMFLELAETGAKNKEGLGAGQYLNECALCHWVKQERPKIKLGHPNWSNCGEVCPFDWSGGNCSSGVGEYTAWIEASNVSDRKLAALRVAQVRLKPRYEDAYLDDPQEADRIEQIRKALLSYALVRDFMKVNIERTSKSGFYCIILTWGCNRIEEKIAPNVPLEIVIDDIVPQMIDRITQVKAREKV